MEFSDPYRGSPVVPHTSEKFFTVYFAGVLVRGYSCTVHSIIMGATGIERDPALHRENPKSHCIF